ncbi:MAG: ParB/RepB/Spo0J family partition protein [Bacteroidales bacterium]|jgi:ParB family transcriptional regulator, chromosome partitioning protein|nr:ParB/RepB/Spo0J family partition protein [Bacteroidales bacterium]
MADKKMVLGRGLDALLDTNRVTTEGSSSINEVDITKIHPNPDQPRTNFDEDALNELAVSIRQLGIIQPITLRKLADDNYQIIVGERRYRASLLAGRRTIPAYVKTADDESVMEMALIENIQREDLNAIEIALAYQKLLDQYQMTQESLSDRLGKKRTTIANYVRLLKLPAVIQLGLKNKLIDMGHARALITMEDPKSQLSLYERIVKEGLSVRKVEELVRKLQKGEPLPSSAATTQKSPEEFKILNEHLSNFFNSHVRLKCNDKGKGNISIAFNSEKELERILKILDTLK